MTPTPDSTEKPEFPMNLKDFPVTSEPMQIHDDTKRMLTFAARDRNYTEYAFRLTWKLQNDGKTAAEVLQAALDTQDELVICTFTHAVNERFYPKPIVWTYERSLALHIIGVMGLEYPGLHDGLWETDGDPSNLILLIDRIADALIDGMHTLGTPKNLSLSQILDYASTFSHGREDDEEES